MTLELNPIYQQARQMEAMRVTLAGMTPQAQDRVRMLVGKGHTLPSAIEAVRGGLIITPLHASLPRGRRQTRKQRSSR